MITNYYIKKQTKFKKTTAAAPNKNNTLYSKKLSENIAKPNCSIYPNTQDIKFRNNYWQIFSNQGSTLHLYGAYFGEIFLQ